MHRQIGFLVELQQLDLKLDGVESEKQAILSRLEEESQALEAEREEISRMEEEISRMEGEIRQLEENRSLELQNVDRSERRLKEIRTQKEYQAVSREISAARKNLDELGNEIASRRETLRSREEERDARRAGLAQRMERFEALRSESDEAIRALDEGTTGDRTRRDTLAGQLTSSLLRRYSQLRIQRKGLAVVEARNGSCLGCNMNIPPQLYNNLFKTTELITCPHCQRVLYLVQQG